MGPEQRIVPEGFMIEQVAFGLGKGLHGAECQGQIVNIFQPQQCHRSANIGYRRAKAVKSGIDGLHDFGGNGRLR